MIVVVVVFLVIVVLSFRLIILSNRFNIMVNDIIVLFNMVWMEVIKDNVSVQFCSNFVIFNMISLLGKGCGLEFGVVYVIMGFIVIKVCFGFIMIIDVIQFFGDVVVLCYDGDGIVKVVGFSLFFNNMVVDICISVLMKENYCEIMMVGGLILQIEKKMVICL